MNTMLFFGYARHTAVDAEALLIAGMHSRAAVVGAIRD